MSFKQDPNDPTKLVPDAPATDYSNALPKGSWAPAIHAIAATAGTDYTECRKVWVGVGGTTITFTFASGGTAVFKNIPDGTMLEIRVTKWAATSGSPSDVVFLY